MKILYNGYPNNGSSIQQKYQLTDDQFRGITQLVIWKFTDSYTGYSFSSDNVLIDYTVKEVTDLSGYQSVVSGSDNNYTITNTHVPEIINLSGTKTWDDNNNQDGIRPDSSTVNLLANGTKVASQEVTADTNWTYTFLNLAKYANGSAITYAVTEDSVDNYTATINGYDITNNYTPDKTSLTVTKVWDDSDDQDGFVLILLMSNYMLMAKNLVML